MSPPTGRTRGTRAGWGRRIGIAVATVAFIAAVVLILASITSV
jgi:hypothetical protein